MIAVLCIDDNLGLRFNRRRQSRDRAAAADLLRSAGGHTVWTAPGSAILFPEGTVTACEEFLERAGEGDWCFVEDRPLVPFLPEIEALVLYRWNRVYPADTYLDVIPWEAGWRCIGREEFPGRSHKLITKEVYVP